MGDIIDNIKAASNGTPYFGYRNILDNAPTVEAISKAEYENRLKTDIVTLLEKIRVEIDKIYEREGHSFDCLNALDDLKEFIYKLQAESEE